jgi:hypothetical protein
VDFREDIGRNNDLPKRQGVLRIIGNILWVSKEEGDFMDSTFGRILKDSGKATAGSLERPWVSHEPSKEVLVVIPPLKKKSIPPSPR